MVRDALDRAAQAGELLYVVVGLLVLGERAFLLDLVVPGEVGLVLGSTGWAGGCRWPSWPCS